MGFQQSAETATYLGIGLPGDVARNSPVRANALPIDEGVASATIGYFYTQDTATGKVSPGGTLGDAVIFAGILTGSKQHYNQGASGSQFNPSMAIPGGQTGEFLRMGHVIVAVSRATTIGDRLIYNQTTGQVNSIAPGANPASGWAVIPNAFVEAYPTSSAGVTLARLTN